MNSASSPKTVLAVGDLLAPYAPMGANRIERVLGKNRPPN